MPSSSMKKMIKASLSTLMLLGVMLGALAIVLTFTKTWPAEMKSLFDMYLFPILIFVVAGLGIISFVKILLEEEK